MPSVAEVRSAFATLTGKQMLGLENEALAASDPAYVDKIARLGVRSANTGAQQFTAPEQYTGALQPSAVVNLTLDAAFITAMNDAAQVGASHAAAMDQVRIALAHEPDPVTLLRRIAHIAIDLQPGEDLAVEECPALFALIEHMGREKVEQLRRIL